MMRAHSGHLSQCRRGAAAVEMAIVAPLLVLLVFGILEVGLLLKDYLGLSQAAREGARIASVGSPLSTIDARIKASAPSIDVSRLTWSGEWCPYDSSGTPGAWTPLADVGSGSDLRNNAAPGSQVKITVELGHQLVTGQIMDFLSDAGNPGTVTLRSSMILRRE
jgi:Flp pilus assembly protein TadG